MTDEQKLKEQQLAGKRAEFFMESPVFQEAVSEVEADIFKAWKDKAVTPEQREEAHRLYVALGLVCSRLQGKINDGKLAESFLEKLKAKITNKFAA